MGSFRVTIHRHRLAAGHRFYCRQCPDTPLSDLSQALGSLRVENTDLLRGNNDLVVTLLPMLINVFAGGLLSDLVEPIELPAFLGFEFDLENTQFTGIEDGEMFTVFTGLRTQEQAITSAVDTSAELIEAHLPDYTTLPNFGLDAWKSIWLDVDTAVWDSGITPSDMESLYQVDGLVWSPLNVLDNFASAAPSSYCKVGTPSVFVVVELVIIEA